MKDNEKGLIKQNRKVLSRKTMYFNRYLLIRYVTAMFFFINIYWLISLLMSHSALFFLPLSILIVLTFSIAEQVRLFNHHTNKVKFTKYSFIILLCTNLFLLVLTCFSSLFAQIYPFLVNEVKAKIVILAILSIGILLSIASLKRLYKIEQNKDKHYQRIKNYEEVMT